MKNIRRKTAIAASAVMLGGVGLALAGCNSASSTSAGAPAAVAAVTSSISAECTWVLGSGGADYMPIVGDMFRFGNDATANNVSATESDGSQLATDAQTAADNPPPIDASDYVTALSGIATAGTDASTGDFADATTESNVALPLFSTVAAQIPDIGSCG